MNGAILISLLFSAGIQAMCLPESLNFNLKSIPDLQAAENAISYFHEHLSGDLPRHHELVVRLDATNPRVNADINKVEKAVVIQVMGGMINHPLMTPNTLLLLLCHEIGHFLGGSPLKSRNGWSATEGQADYFSSFRCVRDLRMSELAFKEAAVRLTKIYAAVTKEPAPRFDRCDEKKVERTNYGYPSVQCRLDTLMAGWEQHDRPRCWFAE